MFASSRQLATLARRVTLQNPSEGSLARYNQPFQLQEQHSIRVEYQCSGESRMRFPNPPLSRCIVRSWSCSRPRRIRHNCLFSGFFGSSFTAFAVRMPWPCGSDLMAFILTTRPSIPDILKTSQLSRKMVGACSLSAQRCSLRLRHGKGACRVHSRLRFCTVFFLCLESARKRPLC